MVVSDWSRKRQLLVAAFACSTVFGLALIALSPPDARSLSVEAFVALDVTVLYVLVRRPEWVPNLAAD